MNMSTITASRRSFLSGLIATAVAGPAIITEAASRPGLWLPQRKLYVPTAGFVGFVDDVGKLVRWQASTGEWLPIERHHEAEVWKRARFPSSYHGREHHLAPPWARG